MLFDDEKYLEESLVWSMICVFCDCSLDLDPPYGILAGDAGRDT